MLSGLRRLLGGSAPAPDEAARAFAAAVAALRQGDARRAVRECERAIAAAPADATMLRQCGAALATAGQLPDAERFLRRALDLVPGDPGAATDLANLHRARREHAAARALYERALAADSAFVPALVNAGLLDLGERAFDAALARFERALAVDPQNALALRHAGQAAFGKGDYPAAERLFKAALAATDDPDAAHGLASTLGALARGREAVGVLEDTAARHPEHLDTLRSLGVLALNRGEAATAAGWLERAAEIAPDDAGLQSNLGLAYAGAGRHDDAIDALQLALHYDPGLIAAHVNLGVAYSEAKRWADAADAFDRALALAPDHPAAAAGSARALQQLYRLEEAEARFRRALELAPSAELWTRLGQAYRDMGRYGDARSAFERALTVDPQYLHALTHLGLVALDEGDPGRAMRCFDEVLDGGVGLDDEALWNITCARLLCGDWERGWEFYEYRWKSPDAPIPPFRFPDWKGDELAGRALLVYAEQGLGDEIMFASCYDELQRRGARLVIDCSPKLEALFRRAFPGAAVHGRKQTDAPDWPPAAPRIDVQAACGTVASHLRRSRAAFPEHSGYLAADPGRVAYWRTRLEALGPGRKLGFSWRGGTTRTRTRLRSVALDDWRPVLALDGVTFVSLQYHADAAAELDEFHRRTGIRVQHWQDAIDDYDETAGLAVALDAIVTVCTAIVHLGGALGRPVHVLVPASPEWRYGLTGETMPWYPTVRLFRQDRPDDWADAVARLRTGLAGDLEEAARS